MIVRGQARTLAISRKDRRSQLRRAGSKQLEGAGQQLLVATHRVAVQLWVPLLALPCFLRGPV